MANYITITSNRVTLPDSQVLNEAIRSATGDSTAVLAANFDGTWRGKKATVWTGPQIASAQSIVDTTAEVTPQIVAQRLVDNMSIYDRARDLTLVDELNRLRAALRGLGVPGLPDITVPQTLAAIRTKTGQLA